MKALILKLFSKNVCDQSKVFDLINREILWEMMGNYGIRDIAAGLVLVFQRVNIDRSELSDLTVHN